MRAEVGTALSAQGLTYLDKLQQVALAWPLYQACGEGEGP